MTDDTQGGKPAKGPFDSDGAQSRGVARGPVSYTHLTLPTNREV